MGDIIEYFKYDDNGFNFITKIHKDTKTKYDIKGYDINGYDIKGYHKVICQYLFKQRIQSYSELK